MILASLGIGIGANSAIFSVVDALLLRPLPYPHRGDGGIWLHSPGIGILRDWPSPGQYIDIQNQNHSFEEMAWRRAARYADGPRPAGAGGRDEHQSTLLHMLGASRCWAAAATGRGQTR